MSINKVQELQFGLMREASFNEYDGNVVVDSLLAHEDLWEGVIMDRASWCFHNEDSAEEKIDLIKLRDIGAGYWNVDTLYILAVEGKEKELESLAKEWGADEVDWYRKDEAQHKLGGGNKTRVLRVWWD